MPSRGGEFKSPLRHSKIPASRWGFSAFWVVLGSKRIVGAVGPCAMISACLVFGVRGVVRSTVRVRGSVIGAGLGSSRRRPRGSFVMSAVR